MSILYVTSFNKKLFRVSGYNMVHSFLDTDTEGDFLVTYEDDIFKDLPKSDKLIYHNLDEDEFLQNWLQDNSDIIPIEYGGTYPECTQCRNPKDRWHGHLPDCLNGGWHARVGQWFRKIAALNEALKYEEKYDVIIFADCDIDFLKKIPEKYVCDIAKGYGSFYHLGLNRLKQNMGIESGFIGFNKNGRGYELLKRVIDSYATKDFRRFERRDDGYVFREIFGESTDINKKDLVYQDMNWHDVTSRPNVKGDLNVVDKGMFAKYISHRKGMHDQWVI